jgi:hypothetical protein
MLRDEKSEVLRDPLVRDRHRGGLCFQELKQGDSLCIIRFHAARTHDGVDPDALGSGGGEQERNGGPGTAPELEPSRERAGDGGSGGDEDQKITRPPLLSPGRGQEQRSCGEEKDADNREAARSGFAGERDEQRGGEED